MRGAFGISGDLTDLAGRACAADVEALRGLTTSGLEFGFCLICGEVFDAIDGRSLVVDFGDICLASLGRSMLVDGFRGEEGCDTFRWLFEMLANGLESDDLDTDVIALTGCPST